MLLSGTSLIDWLVLAVGFISWALLVLIMVICCGFQSIRFGIQVLLWRCATIVVMIMCLGLSEAVEEGDNCGFGGEAHLLVCWKTPKKQDLILLHG